MICRSALPLLQLANLGQRPEFEPNTSTGVVVFGILISIVFSVLFGLWGKAKAEESGVKPWIGFLMGFFLIYIGVRLVPIMRTDKMFYRLSPGIPLPPRPPQADGTTEGKPSEQSAPPKPPPAQVDAEGYVPCAACGTRTKADRKSCMSCGAVLPRSA